MSKRRQRYYEEYDDEDYEPTPRRRQQPPPRKRRRKKKKKRPSFLVRLFRILVLLAILCLVLAAAWHFYVPTPPVAEISTMVSATGISVEEQINANPSHYTRKSGFYTFLLVGSDDGHGNADTIMVAGFDSKTGDFGLISVPRDTLIYRTWSNFPKINAGLSKGIDMLKNEVSYTLGIPIDFYVHIGLDAFIEVVDQLGGIEYDVPQDMYHDDEGGFVIDLKAGLQQLDGRHTLELVRYRGYATADIGRTETQRAVLNILVNQLVSWKSLTKVNDFIGIFQEHVDTNLEYTDFLWFAKQLLSKLENFELDSLTLDGRGDAVYNGYSWCYELDPEKTLEAVNEYLNPYEKARELSDLYLISS